MTEFLNERVLKKIRNKNILVTGGSGFIGKNLIQAIRNVCQVYVVSRNKNSWYPGLIHADICDQAVIENEIKNLDIDIIFHLAGMTPKPTTVCPIGDYYSINSGGTKNLLDICRKLDIPRFIYSSSMSVFGKPGYVPVDEVHPKLPISHYGASKLLGEVYCNQFQNFYKINTTILRYSSVYGPGQLQHEVVPIFIKNSLNNQPLLLHNNGQNSGDFVFVKDVVLANILAATTEKGINQDFNIGSGKEITIEELAKLIITLIDRGQVKLVDNGITEVNRFFFDIFKAKKSLHYSPQTPLNWGLAELIKNQN